ncbi:hypothetical protein AKO1_003632 [Acrasis kona]|uniref:Uncharacterized protein n=1 Tax=Acrasis kona TaxID=1008807 RepID=A0AAW2Z522_9EUKA
MGDRSQGVWWYWYYKDAIPVGSKIPQFEAQGRKTFFGLLGRSKVTSEQLSQQKNSIIIFLPKLDHSVDQLASTILQSFKTSVTMGKHQSEVNMFVTCSSLEEFDQKSKQISSGINLWCDVGGSIASKFGMRPNIQEINVGDILSDSTAPRKYTKQTITGTFFTIRDTIVKSPSYQPKLQQASVSIITTALENLDGYGDSIEKATAVDSFAASMTEKDLQTRQIKAWEVYQDEFNQMQVDLGIIQKPVTKKKVADKKPVKPQDKKVKKKTTTKKSSAPSKTKKAQTKVAANRINKNGDLKSRL